MLELIAIIGGIVLLFYLPHEANKVRGGWVRKNFKGAPADYPAAYVKTLKWLMKLGIVLGCVGLVLAPLGLESGEWVVKLLGATIWFGVAAVAFQQQSKFPQAA